MTMTVLRAVLIVIFLSWAFVVGDYDCLCNYSVEKAVYPTANVNGQPLGYMYEFDCKPSVAVQDTGSNMYKIQYEHQLGFIEKDQQAQIQTCPGNPQAMDLIPDTTKAPIVTTQKPTTTITTTTTTTTTTRPTTTTTPTTTSTTPTTTSTTPTTTSTTPTTSSTTPTTPSTTPTTTSTTPTTTSTTPTTTSTTPTTTSTTPTTTSTTPTTTSTTPTATSTTPTTTSTTPTTTSTTTRPTTTRPTTTATTTATITTTTTTTTTTPTTTTSTTSRPTTTSAPTTTQFAYTNKYWAKAANVTGTPYQYVGIGYNILNGYPNSLTDPGFLTKQRIFQLTGSPTSVREATYEKQSSCTPEKKNILIYGSIAYQDELKQYIKISPTHNVHLTDAAFTFNTEFYKLRASLDSGSGTFVYMHSIASCKLGSVRYAAENATTGHFTVSREFAKDVCALPMDFNALSNSKYMQFLDKWGTSIVTSVDIGTKTIDSYQTTPVKVFQHVQRTDDTLLEQGGAYKGFTSSVTVNTHDYIHSKASNATATYGTFGRRHHAAIGTQSRQAPIAAEIVPILDAFDGKYWKPILDELVREGICSDSIYGSGVAKYGFSLRIALNQYPASKDASTGHLVSTHPLLDRHTIHVPITWPMGTYGLMKATSGCPADNVHWAEGYRKQDTEDLRAHNMFSPSIQNYLSGDFHDNNILTRFCMKTSTHSMSGSQYDQQWPKGSYCVLKKGTCPSGFGSGYIFWDDEDLRNDNAKGGTLPDGTFDSNTMIYYCCRNDGLPTSKILLPTDRPFILVRYKGTCQAVNGMNVHEIFAQWDDEDLNNSDKFYGVHPMDDGGSKNHRIHFCFYQAISGAGLVG